MLRLDIAWLAGTAWLARDRSDPAPDWPPQPDRIFSALVASWGLGGEDVAERAALEWLEACDPPQLAHAPPAPRETVVVYVPPNDPKGSDISILPDRRRRQPRTFPAVSLDADDKVHLSLVWAEAPPTEHLRTLTALARRTSYIGHSTSLVRCRFLQAETAPLGARPARRAAYRGRLAELEALHKRHVQTGDTRARPRPSTRSGRVFRTPPPGRALAGEPEQWIVFEHGGGDRPDLRAAAILADHLRLALMEAWTKTHTARAPGWIAGHEADGSPARDAHLAVVPLANVGWEFSDGRLMGLALVPPAAEVRAWSAPGPEAFRRRQHVLRAVAALGESMAEGGRVLTLAPKGGGGRWHWRLRPAESGRRSLDPSRYLRPAQLWASVTPVLLDRHLKSDGPGALAEAERIVADACTRIGLPRPALARVEKHGSHRGAPPAWPPGGAPDWQGWSRKRWFGERKLCHVRLAFEEPVAGPVLIGAGRFVGLGLCLPLGGET